MKTMNVGAVLDEGPWSRYQKFLVAATALTIILDGLDNQVLPPAIPQLMAEWSLPRGAFTNALTSGALGMMAGGFLGGYLGDRLGRKVALLGSVVVFGVLTIIVSFSTSVEMLIALRFLTGLGIGGAMPNAAAISSEYVPRRQRPFAVTLTIVCIPLGGSLAGFLGGMILPTMGWRALFLISGTVPLVLAGVLFAFLPESPRFLARQRERWPELRALLRKLGHNVSEDVGFIDPTEKAVAKASVGELLVPEYRRDTLALCASFFFCLMTVYMGTNWINSMMASTGFDVGTASYGLTAFNLGGVAGAILGAMVIMRLGSRLSMLTMAAGAILGAIVMSIMPIGPQAAVPVFVMLAWTGGLINAVQTTMYALAAHVFPTSIRATGVGTAVAVGRIGGVISPALGSWALESGGPAFYFRVIAGTMTLTFGALAAVRSHIPGASRAPIGLGAEAEPARH
jgi:AAHS family 4-hydroxybenzoate transporter-like MFS transporter